MGEGRTAGSRKKSSKGKERQRGEKMAMKGRLGGVGG